MARALDFFIDGAIDTIVRIREGDFDGDGFSDLKFTVTVDRRQGTTADLRGLFWDVADERLLRLTSVLLPQSPDVTDSAFRANAVDDLGQGANMIGPITAGGRKFDAGVEIGSPGTLVDDIQSTSFVLVAAGADLTIDEVNGQRFGVRHTHFGEIGCCRDGQLKTVGFAPHAPDAVDDLVIAREDSLRRINLLANDSDEDCGRLRVTSITGGALGTPFEMVSVGGRTALVTVNAGGSFTVDPTGNFEDLAAGQMDRFNLVYHIQDCGRDTDWARVRVTIEGVNDAPVARNDAPFFVEYGDVAFVDVTANDTDIDDAIDRTSLVFSGADLGTATMQGGRLRYAASAIPRDNTDDSANDRLTYTVKDRAGATSNPAGVTARLIDPLRESDSDFARAEENNQLLGLTLATEDRTFNDSSFARVDIAGGTVSEEVNVSFVIDGSGSIPAEDYDQQVAAVQGAIDLLRAEYSESSATVTVQLVQFSQTAESATFDLSSQVLDDVSAVEPLEPFRIGSVTNYRRGLLEALRFFRGNADDDNFLFFASDGLPNRPSSDPADFTDVVARLELHHVSRTAVGFGAIAPEGLSVLNLIDNTGGAEIVESANDLGDVFANSPIFPADLVDFALRVNGTLVADEFDLADLGGGAFNFTGTLAGLDHALGAVNVVVATASFDVDDDGVVDEIRTVRTTVNGTDGSDIFLA